MVLDAQAFKEDIERSILEIGKFVYTDEFQSLLSEFKDVPQDLRSSFIDTVIINKAELAKRNIRVPDGMIIQKSRFGDQRPTLFCITKYLQDKKRKVTITFDEGWGKKSIMTSP